MRGGGGGSGGVTRGCRREARRPRCLVTGPLFCSVRLRWSASKEGVALENNMCAPCSGLQLAAAEAATHRLAAEAAEHAMEAEVATAAVKRNAAATSRFCRPNNQTVVNSVTGPARRRPKPRQRRLPRRGRRSRQRTRRWLPQGLCELSQRQRRSHAPQTKFQLGLQRSRCWQSLVVAFGATGTSLPCECD